MNNIRIANFKIRILVSIIIGLTLAVYILYMAILNLLWISNVREAVTLMNQEIIWPSTQFGKAVPKKKEVTSVLKLNLALTHLARAQTWQNKSRSTHYLAALVYAAQDKWQRAAESLANAQSISAQQMPGWASLLANEKLGTSFSKLEPIYKAEGFSARQLHLFREADRALLNAQFLTASRTYQLAMTGVESANIPIDLLFRYTIAASISNDNSRDRLLMLMQHKDNSFFIHKVVNMLQIDGDQLRWMTPVSPPTVTFGTKLNYPYGGKIGTMWWAGQAASLISVASNDSYQLSFTLLPSGKPPVEMVIGMDGTMLRSVTLGKENAPWEVFNFEIYLHKGFHTINIWFLNNDDSSGAEKDAFIESITVSRQVTSLHKTISVTDKTLSND